MRQQSGRKWGQFPSLCLLFYPDLQWTRCVSAPHLLQVLRPSTQGRGQMPWNRQEGTVVVERPDLLVKFLSAHTTHAPGEGPLALSTGKPRACRSPESESRVDGCCPPPEGLCPALPLCSSLETPKAFSKVVIPPNLNTWPWERTPAILGSLRDLPRQLNPAADWETRGCAGTEFLAVQWLGLSASGPG